MLVKDRLGNIYDNFDSNFNNTGKKFLKRIAKDEKEIDYDNLFFKINDNFFVKIVDFLQEFGTLYDLLIYLLGNANRIINATEDQINFFKAIYALKKVISSMKNDIIDQSEEQKKKLFGKQEGVLNNA